MSIQLLGPDSVVAGRCVSHVLFRMKAMVEAPRRPTMQEIQARRKSSTPGIQVSTRRGISLPNLEDDTTTSFKRNSAQSRIIASDHGGTSTEAQTFQIDIMSGKDQRFLCSPSSPYIFSLPLCVLAPRNPPKPATLFKLPDFPAALSFHSVQSYYSELIGLLGKAIFSVQHENPALLARYCAFVVLEALV